MNFNQSLTSHRVKLLLLIILASVYFITIMAIILKEGINDNKIYYKSVIILSAGCISFISLIASRIHKINKLNNYFARDL